MTQRERELAAMHEMKDIVSAPLQLPARRCDYCGGSEEHCHRCLKQVQFDVLQLIDQLEQWLLMPDQSDEIGINDHLRAAWGLRDAINTYFSIRCDRDPATNER